MLHRHWLRTLGVPGAYDLADVPSDGLDAFFAGLRGRGYVGGNVTVPHKQAVMPYLARVDETARAIGAVNTIWSERGAWVGGNTDAAGFLANLDERAPGWDAAVRPAVVLGAGGAARAVAFGLLGRGLRVRLFNRTRDSADALAAHMGENVVAHDMATLPESMRATGLFVNTTSLGMHGKPLLEIDLRPLPDDAVVCDIVYVPLDTRLLRAARARGLRTVDGLGMLLHQACGGFAHWFGAEPRVTAALRELIAADIER